METREEEARILTCINRDVLCLVNSWGEEILSEFYVGQGKYLEEMHMPAMYTEPDQYGDLTEPEPMQYFIIDEWLAKQMLKHEARRDPVMETTDGLWIWVRCGYGYGLYDDLARYYMD